MKHIIQMKRINHRVNVWLLSAVIALSGAIAGGSKGAAIGALLGAGVGAGSVYIQGNKDLLLEPGTEMVALTSVPENTRAYH